jgi:hypothetical protein
VLYEYNTAYQNWEERLMEPVLVDCIVEAYVAERLQLPPLEDMARLGSSEGRIVQLLVLQSIGPGPIIAGHLIWAEIWSPDAQRRLQGLKRIHDSKVWEFYSENNETEFEAAFWSWFAMHDPSEAVRRFCIAVLTTVSGSEIAEDGSVVLSELGEQRRWLFDQIATASYQVGVSYHEAGRRTDLGLTE